MARGFVQRLGFIVGWVTKEFEGYIIPMFLTVKGGNSLVLKFGVAVASWEVGQLWFASIYSLRHFQRGAVVLHLAVGVVV
jgi:hypothetical protein